jgi:hypothetical protein
MPCATAEGRACFAADNVRAFVGQHVIGKAAKTVARRRSLALVLIRPRQRLLGQHPAEFRVLDGPKYLGEKADHLGLQPISASGLPALVALATRHTHGNRDNKEHEKNVEQNLGDLDRTSCDSSKTQERSDQRNHQEYCRIM